MSDSEQTPPPSSTKSKKRGPGRPPKKVARAVIPRNGILEAPRTKEEIPQLQVVMEYYYDNPNIIKKTFGLFKHMDSKKVNLYFRKDKIICLAKDFKENNHIYVELLCERVNGYFIEEPFEVGLNLANIIPVINKITKEYQSITIWCNRSERGEQLNITLYNDKLDNKSTSHINLEKLEPSLNINEVEHAISKLDTYPIQFTLESKIFKKKIMDALALGPKLRIEKNGEDEPLQLVVDHNEGVGVDTDTFDSPERISLKSTIGNDLFSTTVYLTYLKALANALISEELNIAAAKYDDLIFTAFLDSDYDSEAETVTKKEDSESCKVHVMTKIIDFRTDTGDIPR